jgi:hypothetical protein
MARARLLSKSLSTSEKRAALHTRAPDLAEFAQALYPLLVVHADDLGRFDGDAFTVKHQVDPTSPRALADFDAALDALDDVGLITRYLDPALGKRAMQIVDFKQHQPGLKQRETASKFSAPPPRTAHTGTSRQDAADDGTARQPAADDALPGSRARAELNVKGREQNKDKYAPFRAHDPNPREPDDNVAVIAKLVATEFADTQLPEPELRAAVKERCAELHIAYDGATIGKALDSARHHRKAARA